jgi:hypothetical protein
MNILWISFHNILCYWFNNHIIYYSWEWWNSWYTKLWMQYIYCFFFLFFFRYLAVTQPLNYSRRRRSKRLALVMILIVWILALAITCPPILGWWVGNNHCDYFHFNIDLCFFFRRYEPGRRNLLECRYNQNEGYVVFSAMGSFFIPMAVMIYVYARISCVVASRHDLMADSEVHKVIKYFMIFKGIWKTTDGVVNLNMNNLFYTR